MELTEKFPSPQPLSFFRSYHCLRSKISVSPKQIRFKFRNLMRWIAYRNGLLTGRSVMLLTEWAIDWHSLTLQAATEALQRVPQLSIDAHRYVQHNPVFSLLDTENCFRRQEENRYSPISSSYAWESSICCYWHLQTLFVVVDCHAKTYRAPARADNRWCQGAIACGWAWFFGA